MDEQWKAISTSPESTFSEFSSHDSATTGESIPTTSSMPVFLPLRSSTTLSNMTDITNTSEFQSFLDDFNSQQSSKMSRWQSDAENLNRNTHSSSNGTYLINDFLANRNIASSSTADGFYSPVSRLPTSTSIMSFHSNTNQKSLGNQRVSWSAVTNSMEQLVIQNDHANRFPSAFSSLSARSSNRQSFSAIDNLLSVDCGNKPLVHSQQQSQPQPQMVQSTGRSNSMPSWRGYLPTRFEPITDNHYQIATHFSQKVFLGGIPPELTEAELLLVLRKFGKCNIKWPKNDTHNNSSSNSIPSFCHVVFRESRSVSELLKHCTRQQQRSTTEYFLHIHMSPSSSLSTRTNRLKPIQVVPWNMKDNVYVMNQENVSAGETTYKDWSRTIFVSPLHGKMTAFSLGTVMSNVFGAVSMAQVNTDKYGYPTGTGTVLFCDSHSYMRAVAAGAIDIKSDCFHKLLDIDPFLRENEPCAFCSSNADLFCRNFHCLRSFCRQCWVNRHGPKPLADHQPATRRQQPLLQI